MNILFVQFLGVVLFEKNNNFFSRELCVVVFFQTAVIAYMQCNRYIDTLNAKNCCNRYCAWSIKPRRTEIHTLERSNNNNGGIETQFVMIIAWKAVNISKVITFRANAINCFNIKIELNKANEKKWEVHNQLINDIAQPDPITNRVSEVDRDLKANLNKRKQRAQQTMIRLNNFQKNTKMKEQKCERKDVLASRLSDGDDDGKTTETKRQRITQRKKIVFFSRELFGLEMKENYKIFQQKKEIIERMKKK